VLNALLGLAGRLTPLADGRVLIPVLGGLSGWAFVSGTIQPFAPRRWTAVSTLAAVGVVAVATLTYAPGLPSVGAFAGDLIFPLVAFVGSWQLSVGTVSADELVQQSLLAHLRERSTARVDQVLEAEVSVLRRELIDLDDAVRGAAPGQWRDAAGNSLREAQDQFTELTRTGLDRVRHTVTSRNAGAGSSPTLG
jgi:hypothetical protein